MAQKKFTELTAADALTGIEVLAVVQGGTSKKTTAAAIALSSGHWRGAYDLSVDAYPSSGGSGEGGSIQSGDEWYVSVSGDLDLEGLGIITINAGALIKALVNTPGSTPANWKVIQ